jgi:RimJ/RimL family protein N-acetyltransferase
LGASIGGMQLRPITMADLPLYEALLTDPRMMSELGGPLPADVLPEKLRGIVQETGADRSWYFVIEEGGEAAGSVCVWDVTDEGDPYTEIGWMVLPAFQGRGLASAAVLEVLDRARVEGRWTAIHAHPGVTNGPSNAICRKTGFERLGELDITYMGRVLRCAHWRVELTSG